MSDDRLRRILTDILGRTAVAETGDFSLPEAGLDSMGMIELLSALETEFGVRVPPAEVRPENFGSFAALTSYVDTRVGDAR